MPEVHRNRICSVETGHDLSQPDKYFVNLLSVNIQYVNRCADRQAANHEAIL
jgi:hypothetical protein